MNAITDLVLPSHGRVHEAMCCVERRLASGALLARQTGKGTAA